MVSQKKYDVFISYSRDDSTIADEICSAFDKVGITYFIDRKRMGGVSNYVTKIAEEIDNSRVMLLLASANSYTSKFVTIELHYAFNHNIVVLPYSLDETLPPKDFEILLIHANWHYRNADPIDTTLLASVSELIKNEQHKLNEYKPTTIDKGLPITGDNTLTIQHGTCQFDMIRVEGGKLLIGATEEQVNAEKNEHPAHEVTLSTFYIGKYPITQDVWESVMGYNRSRFKQDPDGYKLLPVESITYDEAQEFVRRLSEITKLRFSLPTEEEWEYAARGGQKTMHYQYAGGNDINEVAWYKGNSNAYTHPVGLKKPNELGIYDMCGNVWEWTETPAHAYGLAIEAKGDIFIRRGGSWWHEASNCRLSYRYASARSKKTSGLGLRVVIRENIK